MPLTIGSINFQSESSGNQNQEPSFEIRSTSNNFTLVSSADDDNLFVSNGNRTGFMIQNLSETATIEVYYTDALDLDSAVAARIEPKSYWEMPTPAYVGALSFRTVGNIGAEVAMTELFKYDLNGN